MDWTSQDDIEGECAPTQLVPASQACDIAEESALEFNADARDRGLLKPGGKLVPAAGQQYVQLVESEDLEKIT